MNHKSNKFHNFQLVYPHEGSVCKSNTLTKGSKKCYQEFKRLNDINEGIFTMKDLDKNKEYNFKVKNNKMYKMNNDQTGGETKKPLNKQENIPLETDNEPLDKQDVDDVDVAVDGDVAVDDDVKEVIKQENIPLETDNEPLDKNKDKDTKQTDSGNIDTVELNKNKDKDTKQTDSGNIDTVELNKDKCDPLFIPKQDQKNLLEDTDLDPIFMPSEYDNDDDNNSNKDNQNIIPPGTPTKIVLLVIEPKKKNNCIIS